MQFVNLIKLQNVMESGEIRLLFPPGLTEPKPKVVISLISFYAVLKSACWSIIFRDYGLFFW